MRSFLAICCVVICAVAEGAGIVGVEKADLKLPTPEFPFHHIACTLQTSDAPPAAVMRVEVDGKELRIADTNERDIRMFNGPVPAGETYTASIEGGGVPFTVIAPCQWTNGSSHEIEVTVSVSDGAEKVLTGKAKAPEKGGYWDSARPRYVSLVVKETAGIDRESEPVHATLGVFSDDVDEPSEEMTVITYAPEDAEADDAGYVTVPFQVLSVAEWRDEKMLNTVETDSETGKNVKRYDPTKTVEMMFLADVAASEEKVYQVLYGNKDAETPGPAPSISVDGEGYEQRISNDSYEFHLAENSGAVDTVLVKGDGEPVLLEHRLETNGAVHWNPGLYAPPHPWVHCSDWEQPNLEIVTGPLMHRTNRWAAMPIVDEVEASISYTFYGNQPYVLMTSLMEFKEDVFLMAARNGEMVFNHAVLNEFVWLDPHGEVQSRMVETMRKHPVHGLEIPADTPWMALINREQKVGFASINLVNQAYNRFAELPSVAQPYIYVQNGPWVYWARIFVYPFGGKNLTRMMRVREGSTYYEKCAWVPFRFAEGSEPFAELERLNTTLRQPLLVHEWMPVDEERTPRDWVMPILTEPFDEGVEGAVSAHKPGEKK